MEVLCLCVTEPQAIAAKTKFRIFDELPNFESTTLHVSRLSLSQPALSAQLASPPLATGRLTRVLPLCEEWKIRIHFLLRDVYELTFVRPSPLGVGLLSRLPRHR